MDPWWLSVAFVALGLIGVVALAAVAASRPAVRWLARQNDWLVTAVIELSQVSSGVVGVYSAFADGDEQAWLRASLAGFASLVAWKVVQIAVAHRQKQAAERGRLRSESLALMLSGIRNCVDRKFKRVHGLVAKLGRTQRSIGHVREALPTQPQLDDLLEQLAAVLQGGRRWANVRVGLYVNRAGFMEPLSGVSLKTVGYVPFNSFKSHRGFFELCGSEVAHVVRSVREKRTIFVPDCREAERAGKFQFSHGEQRAYLRSLVVCYLGKVLVDGAMADAVLSIDANSADFFRDESAILVEGVVDEFGLRVRFELTLKALLDNL